MCVCVCVVWAGANRGLATKKHSKPTFSKLSMSKLSVQIDATSDLACPWCYVAYRRMVAAIHKFDAVIDFQINWHPFMIDKKTQKQGEEYLAYNIRRWGGDGWVHDMKRTSRKDGCLFSNWRTWPNSFNAHRLMLLAKRVSWQEAHEIKLALFEKCYEEGQNISDVNVLISIGEESGLPNCEDYMNSETGNEEVTQDDYDAKRRGVTGVPDFVITCGAREAALHGAQVRGF